MFFRSGLRYFEMPSVGASGHTEQEKPVPFENCAFNIMTDCLENLITRSISQQKATEETRNEVVKLKTLFTSLATQHYLEKTN